MKDIQRRMERLDRVSDSRLTIPGLFSMLLSTKLTARTKERIVTKIPSYLLRAEASTCSCINNALRALYQLPRAKKKNTHQWRLDTSGACLLRSGNIVASKAPIALSRRSTPTFFSIYWLRKRPGAFVDCAFGSFYLSRKWYMPTTISYCQFKTTRGWVALVFGAVKRFLKISHPALSSLGFVTLSWRYALSRLLSLLSAY